MASATVPAHPMVRGCSREAAGLGDEAVTLRVIDARPSA
jgi:hypothetical protein